MVQQACSHIIQVPNALTGKIRHACCVLFALCMTCLVTGCVDGSRIRVLKEQVAERLDAVHAEERQIEQQRATVAVVTRKIESIEAERAPKLQQLAWVRKESPTISACVLGQGDVKGTLVAIFGASEAERQAGGFVAAVCVLARFHDDYNSVSRQVDAILPELAAVSERLAESLAQRREAEAALNQMTAATSAPRLRLEIDTINSELACEQDFSCRTRRLFAGKGS